MDQNKPNMNVETGIRYGVISTNTPSPEAVEEVFAEGVNINYEERTKEIKRQFTNLIEENYLSNDLRDDIMELLEERCMDNWDSSPDDTYEYDDDEYIIETAFNNTQLYVMKSPYYTIAKPCSPCAPGAIDLDTAETGMKRYDEGNSQGECDVAYCLGHDWFDDDKAPYTVYSVETNAEILSDVV